MFAAPVELKRLVLFTKIPFLGLPNSPPVSTPRLGATEAKCLANGLENRVRGEAEN